MIVLTELDVQLQHEKYSINEIFYRDKVTEEAKNYK